jgi:hypothetical protein
MLKEPAMGDTPVPSSKPNGSSASDKSASPESHTKLNTSAPPTDDIDSEWPSEDDPPKPAVAAATHSDVTASSRPVTAALDDVDSGWGSEADDSEGALSAPVFPADPALPRDLRSPSGVPSSRPAPVAEVSPSKREMDTVPAAPQASRPPNSGGPNSSGRVRASEPRIVEAAAITPREQPASPLASTPPRETATETRHSFDPHIGAASGTEAKGASRAPIVLALSAAAAAALWLLRPAPAGRAPEVTRITSAAVSQPAPEVAKAPSRETREEPRAEPVPAGAAPSAAPSAAVASNISVVISVKPPQARVFYRGKEVGHPPVTVEIEPGKRRAYEVALPGYLTRKVVIDGSKTEVQVGLRPDPAASTPAAP